MALKLKRPTSSLDITTPKSSIMLLSKVFAICAIVSVSPGTRGIGLLGAGAMPVLDDKMVSVSLYVLHWLTFERFSLLALISLLHKHTETNKAAEDNHAGDFTQGLLDAVTVSTPEEDSYSKFKTLRTPTKLAGSLSDVDDGNDKMKVR